MKKEEITEEEDPLADTCTTGAIDKETSIQDPLDWVNTVLRKGSDIKEEIVFVKDELMD